MAGKSEDAVASSSGSGAAGASSASAGTGAAAVEGEARPYRAPALVVVGMAGSGKTTLVDTLSAWLENEEELDEALPSQPDVGETEGKGNAADLLPGEGAYVVNLDPAVLNVPYEPNVDIRDTVKYKSVMQEYSLGPNGAIITSLNLFATRFDQVLELVEKRSLETKAVIFDTPGQIETFTWSASGAIITESLAMSLPTVMLFVVDTPRSESAMTFVSNMLYACSMMYKSRLPMIVVFNKVDVASSKFVESWMRDYDEFDKALKEDNFAGTLARSMALALEEFYKVIRSVSVSANTGEGMADLVRSIKEAAMEYEKEYRPIVEERMRLRKEEEEERQRMQLGQLRSDLEKERQTSFAPYNVVDEELEEKEKLERAHREALANADPEEKKEYEHLVEYLNKLEEKT